MADRPRRHTARERLSVPTAIERYWAQFLASRPVSGPRLERYVEAFFFGTKPDHAHEINPLVLDGTKTATGCLLWSLEADGKPTPAAGDHWVVTDGGDQPVCIILTTNAQVIPFDQVGSDYALWGGEGDRSLESWRDMYWSYIESECARIGRTPEPHTPLVMERFEVVYAELLGPAG
jgi:uncharacterized protein YhfF